MITVREILKTVRSSILPSAENIPDDIFISPMNTMEEFDDISKKLVDKAYVNNVVSVTALFE